MKYSQGAAWGASVVVFGAVALGAIYGAFNGLSLSARPQSPGVETAVGGAVIGLMLGLPFSLLGAVLGVVIVIICHWLNSDRR